MRQAPQNPWADIPHMWGAEFEIRARAATTPGQRKQGAQRARIWTIWGWSPGCMMNWGSASCSISGLCKIMRNGWSLRQAVKRMVLSLVVRTSNQRQAHCCTTSYGLQPHMCGECLCHHSCNVSLSTSGGWSGSSWLRISISRSKAPLAMRSSQLVGGGPEYDVPGEFRAASAPAFQASMISCHLASAKASGSTAGSVT